MVRTRIVSTLAAFAIASVTLTGCVKKPMKTAEVRVPGNAPGRSTSGDSIFEAPTGDAAPPVASTRNVINRPTPQWQDGTAPDLIAPPEPLPTAAVVPPAVDTSPFEDDATGGITQAPVDDSVQSAVEIADLDMVHFEYDAFKISETWQDVLKQHIAWLKNNNSVHVQIEGHCDERGTEEYNVTLGQRRADAVREFMIANGVEEHRLSTISYGKLRPLTFDQSEDAHSLNRRAMFLVYTPDQQTAAAY